MKNNYLAFLVLGTFVCGGAEVGAQEAVHVYEPIKVNSAGYGRLQDDGINLGVIKIGDLIQEAQGPAIKLRGSNNGGLVKASGAELKNLAITNKRDTLVGTKEDMALTLNTFLDIFKDTFKQAKNEYKDQLKGDAEKGVKLLLDALKNQFVSWGETAKNVMTQLLDATNEIYPEKDYPVVMKLLKEGLKKVKFTKIEGKLVALIREKSNDTGCCGCLAKSALGVYQYYKNQGQKAPIVVPKEEQEALSEVSVGLDLL